MTCATFGSAFYLKKVHGWDMLSALFGAAPGALSQVMVYATQYHADLRGIAIVQTVRVVDPDRLRAAGAWRCSG